MHITESKVVRKFLRTRVISRCWECSWRHVSKTREEAEYAAVCHAVFPNEKDNQ